MENLIIYRPLLFAFIEYSLAFYAFRHLKFSKNLIATLLFFLASYQLGEFIYIITGETSGIQFASFSTSILPPMGLMLLENITRKNYYSYIFAAFGIVLGLILLLVPEVQNTVGTENCFVKYATVHGKWENFILLYNLYYAGTLLYAMVLAIANMFTPQMVKFKRTLVLYFLAYASFFPTSLIYVLIFGKDSGFIPSIMCALGIIAAAILVYAAKDPILEELA